MFIGIMHEESWPKERQEMSTISIVQASFCSFCQSRPIFYRVRKQVLYDIRWCLWYWKRERETVLNPKSHATARVMLELGPALVVDAVILWLGSCYSRISWINLLLSELFDHVYLRTGKTKTKTSVQRFSSIISEKEILLNEEWVSENITERQIALSIFFHSMRSSHFD